ncbi:hypothetical protein FOXG_22292 [Fusarium oxysporum f. sp. lycopersici 4287]|uniref:Uncharacterized protein n=1 Tax=Fusarium oxysporum f. sp. lycopersici (strain 4287 / CBS 123668 / FGSC 9935 / NRRL 34936) TaxID=426428 RepID=A0A0J9W765_FUSO4|nr:hypothetical protein FOXG_22292 [Fusarium oxysporum f. sp. lycopersici 4287]KNB18570.1 hypothetical protein FOXG_22292 [Fusarium oxysporum f. sp. lycopersici 4287]
MTNPSKELSPSFFCSLCGWLRPESEGMGPNRQKPGFSDTGTDDRQHLSSCRLWRVVNIGWIILCYELLNGDLSLEHYVSLALQSPSIIIHSTTRIRVSVTLFFSVHNYAIYQSKSSSSGATRQDRLRNSSSEFYFMYLMPTLNLQLYGCVFCSPTPAFT